MPLNIVLVQPEIHANTGNIARTCACTGLTLHLVHPMGFATDASAVRRAGLDYWDRVQIKYHNSFDELFASRPGCRWFFTTAHTPRLYHEVRYQVGDYLVFGKESDGLADDILDNYPGTRIRIPMQPRTRSLNLSNAAAVIAYEALRQLDFPKLT